MWLNRFAQLNRGSLPELSRFPVMFVLRLTSDLEGGGVTEVVSSCESLSPVKSWSKSPNLSSTALLSDCCERLLY